MLCIKHPGIIQMKRVAITLLCAGAIAALLYALLTPINTTSANTSAIQHRNIAYGTGTQFEAGGVALQTSEAAQVRMRATGEMIRLRIATPGAATSTALTFSGLMPDVTYHLYRNGYRDHAEVATDLDGMYTFTVDIAEPTLFILQQGEARFSSATTERAATAQPSARGATRQKHARLRGTSLRA